MTEKPMTPAEALAAMAAGAGPAGQFGVFWAETMTEMSSEVLNFLSRRLHEDAETHRKLMECTDLESFTHVQAEFVQGAIEDYAAETGRLVEIGTGVLKKAGIDPPI